MSIKVSDYIVEFLINKGVTDVFGYPGGMVTQLMDSFERYREHIQAHANLHEQAAAFAACGYAQVSGKPGIAYATSGPGATNLMTGIANAYFDSIPTVFITGQVNSNEAKGSLRVRQRGFQETDIVSIATPITKLAVHVEKAEHIPYEMERAYQIAMAGRRGPVLLDISMNIFRSEIDVSEQSYEENAKREYDIGTVIETIAYEMEKSDAPVFLIGAGAKIPEEEDHIRTAINRFGIPTVSSMVAFDVMRGSDNFYGFIGAYGSRAANFIVSKSDLIISVGSRLDIRQVGYEREKFAPNAKIIRFDIDGGELEYRVHEDEEKFLMGIDAVADALDAVAVKKDYSSWRSVCDEIRNLLYHIDEDASRQMLDDLSEKIPDDTVITTDVGQNQVWVAQSLKLKPKQRVLFSGGHGAMGYSLPAAIGAYYGSGGKTVCSITGDGGMQMNIQELQFIAREQVPVKIVVLNNNALGMIRHFQEMYFASRFFQTKPEGGYSSPNFARIAEAYGIRSRRVEMEDIKTIEWIDEPELIEIMIRNDTYVVPKLEFGKENQDQEPLIDRRLYERIMKMKSMRGGYCLRCVKVYPYSCISFVRRERGWAA